MKSSKGKLSFEDISEGMDKLFSVVGLDREGKINFILRGLKMGGFNEKIEADGKFEKEGKRGLVKLLATPPGENLEGVILMNAIFKYLGFWPDSEIGQFASSNTRLAVKKLREWLKEGVSAHEGSLPIEELNLPLRVKNALLRADIQNINDLPATEEELLRRKWIGHYTVRVLRKALIEKGFVW